MLIDLPLAELVDYRPEPLLPADFDAFWERTLDEARSIPLEATFDPFDAGLRTVDTYDVTFRGFGGHPIKGWLNVPRGAGGPLAAVVEYIGYGGGRGLPHDWLVFSAAGYAHLVMDTRGQGGSWLAGDTPDPAPGGGTHHPGFLTLGIEHPESHYYRRLYVDGVRAVEAVRAFPGVDAERVAVLGASQGGGITLAVAGLVGDLRAALPSVPFLCDMRRASELVDTHPYVEIARYLRSQPHRVDEVFGTLAYFDGVNFAPRATAPALFSVALMDDICPPSTVFAAYNRYAAEKDIRVWPFSGHEGAPSPHTAEQLRYLRPRLA
jgi:cephalosporin-C deacetylase